MTYLWSTGKESRQIVNIKQNITFKGDFENNINIIIAPDNTIAKFKDKPISHPINMHKKIQTKPII